MGLSDLLWETGNEKGVFSIINNAMLGLFKNTVKIFF